MRRLPAAASASIGCRDVGQRRGRGAAGTSDERELLLRWLNRQRMAVIREGLSDRNAHWTPGGR